MGTDVRRLRADEFDAFVAVLESSAGRHVTAQALGDAAEAYPVDRAWCAFDSGRLVAGTSSDVLELTLPGNVVVPATRPTLTAVLPTHRTAGLASALLTRQLRDFRERGEVLAAAFTSTPALLDGLGYACAGRAAEVRIDPHRVALHDAHPEGPRLRMLDADKAGTVLPDLFDRHRRVQPGQVLRTESFWRLWFQDRELYRVGSGPRFVVVAEQSGDDVGYLTYRLQSGDLREQPVDTLVVEDLVTVTAAARRELWRYLVRFRQAVAVVAPHVPVDDPLRWLLREPRGLRTTRVRDFLWLRLVDVRAALAQRRYALPATLVLDVRDALLPANTSCLALQAAGDDADVQRTDAAPELSLDVADLAAVYLGGTSFSTLARAGRVRECQPGAIDRADALFRSERAPWTVSDW